MEMAKKKPRSDKAFLEIKGVGEKKLKEFGSEFLMAISSHKK